MFRQTPARFQEMRPHKIPEPPLNPYMRFSRKHWQKVRNEHPEAPLWDISRYVAEKWKLLNDTERKEYEVAYEQDKAEYEKMMKATSSTCNKKAMRQSIGGNRRQDQNPGVVIQPVIDEDLYEITPKRLAAMRFERNQRLCVELFNGVPLPDPRAFVAPIRIEQLRKQGDNLDAHKKKITDEMIRAEEVFIQRKRAIQEESEKFEVELKKACDLRPKVDEDRYNVMVEEMSEKLLEQWAAYQTRQEALKEQNDADKQSNPILYSLTASPGSENKTNTVEATNADATTAVAPPGDEAPPADEAMDTNDTSNVNNTSTASGGETEKDENTQASVVEDGNAEAVVNGEPTITENNTESNEAANEAEVADQPDENNLSPEEEA